MKKVKLLHVITRLDKGGSSENTILTVRGLARGIYDITLLSGATQDPDRLVVDLPKDEIKQASIKELVRPMSPLRDVSALLKLYDFMRKEKFDVVHTHSSKAGILGRWAARFAGIPVLVHTPHGHVFYGYFGKVRTGFYTFLERITACLTDRIIGLTPTEIKEHLERNIGTPGKYVSIPSGVELEKYLNFSCDAEAEKRKFGLPTLSRVIGVIARLEPVKGVRYLLEAFPDVIKRFPDTWLLIVGGGSQKCLLKKLAGKLGISGRVIFAEPQEDVRPALAALDIFVLPSLNEGMGRVLVEAMAMGKPIVASSICGIKDVVSDECGMLVEPKDPAAIADAVIKLLAKPESAADMAGRAKKSVWPKYDARTMVASIDELYQNLLKEKGLSYKKDSKDKLL